MRTVLLAIIALVLFAWYYDWTRINHQQEQIPTPTPVVWSWTPTPRQTDDYFIVGPATPTLWSDTEAWSPARRAHSEWRESRGANEPIELKLDHSGLYQVVTATPRNSYGVEK